MLSRVADAVFWTARYMERTDNILRMLRTNYIASQDEILEFDWRPWVKQYGPPDDKSQIEIVSYRDVINYLILSRQHDASVFSFIVRARENARSVQDFITKELWQCLNDYYHLIRSPHTEQLLLNDDPLTAMDSLLRESTIYYGTVDTTMGRGEGYTFINLGKFVERSLQSLDLLSMKLETLPKGASEASHWKYLLYSLSGYEFHGKYYKNSLHTHDVIHQLLFNPQFPHSVLYSLIQTERYFKRLGPISLPDHFKEIEFAVGKAVNDLKYSLVDCKDVDNLQELFKTSRQQVLTIGQKLATLYFGYS
ncbi:MAG: alpha-E domain-containing protein [Bacteroidia bacterium]|nr:alpha-E domain-containing protein [Bacteroidia bacterium]